MLRLLLASALFAVFAAATPATAHATTTTSTEDAVSIAVVVDTADGLAVTRVEAYGPRAALTVAQVAELPRVVAAEIDQMVHAFNDPLRTHQWGLDRLKAETAWTYGTAAGQTVAVIDTGVDAAHPDLAGVVVNGFDAFDSSTHGKIDPNGHGTHVAGIIGAVTGNNIGVASMAPGAKVMPVRVLDEDGTGFSSDVAEGMLWAISNGATVVNLSLGSPNQSSVVTAAINQAVTQGVVVVAAAGNEGENGNPVIYPAALDAVIAVGAIDQQDRHAAFSGNGAWLDLTAPGVQIASTMDSQYMYSTGTSMAAPFVSATVALVKARNTSITPAQVSTLLSSTAQDLGAPGFDPLFGHGLVNPVAALSSVVPPSVPVEEPIAEDEQVIAASPVEEVGSSPDVTLTAIDISQATFPDDHSATMAVLSRDDSFADSLAGAGLAGAKGPILYTTGGPDRGLREESAGELRRVLRRGAKVIVLGGTNAVSEKAVRDVEALGFSVVRMEGASRVETAIAIAQETDPSPSRVLVARADNWADAVTGGAFAASESVPLLLTQSDTLHPAVLAYLAAVKPAEVVLLGGEAALSAAVANSLSGKVTRVSGPTRAGTAVAIAEQLWGRNAGRSGDRFVVTDGYATTSWAPALAAAVLSATTGSPQLVVNGADRTNPVPPETSAYLSRLGYSSTRTAHGTIVGPLTSSKLANDLRNLLS